MKAPITVELGEVMATKSGSVDPSRFSHEAFDLYSIPAFDRGEPDIAIGADIGSAKPIVEPSDVLLSKIVPHIRRSWVVGPNRGRRLIASGEWIVFRSARLHPPYLRHVLIGDPFHAQFMQTVSGVGGSLLRARPSHVANIRVPLPPLPEQQRIAEILDKADALRAKRRSTLAQLDFIKESIFIDMFGDLAGNSKGWSAAGVLSDVADVVSGITKGRKVNGMSQREVPYLAVANVQHRALNLAVVKRIEATEAEIARYRLRQNDLVLTEGGDPDKLGRGTVWNDELPICIHQNHIFRVRLTSKRFDPVFMSWQLGSGRGKRYFLRAAKQTTGIASINSTQLKGFPLLAPPLELQREFTKRLSAVDQVAAEYRASMAQMDALFSVLQYQGFRGELCRSL